jgi:hypothetical protein
MIRTSILLSATVLILLLFGLLNRLYFLAPWRRILFSHCGGSIAFFTGVVGLNLIAATHAINRKILLKDTGRKLSHFDNQLHAERPDGLPPFLSERH